MKVGKHVDKEFIREIYVTVPLTGFSRRMKGRFIILNQLETLQSIGVGKVQFVNGTNR